jgi:hypothetical protein
MNTLATGVPIWLFGDGSGVHSMILGAALLAHVWLFMVLKRRFDVRPTIFGAAFLVGAGSWWGTLSQIWNPAFIPIIPQGCCGRPPASLSIATPTHGHGLWEWRWPAASSTLQWRWQR